jgi:MFS family permease
VGLLEARMSKPGIVAIAFAVSGVVLLAVSPVIGPITVLVASFLLGLSFAWKKIPVDTLVQQAIPDKFRGRVFAVYDFSYNMSRVVAAVLAIPLIPAVGVPACIALSGLVFLLWAPVLPRLLSRTPAVGRMVEVRFYAGGRADEVPRSIILDGVEQPVQVGRSWREERGRERVLVYELRLPDGSAVRIRRSEDEPEQEWRLDRT